jgi:hypothetical protein
MATKALNFKFTGTTTPISSYDETKINLGSLIKKYTGPLPTDKFIGPAKIGLARPMEQSTPIPGIYPHVIPFSSTIDWVFLADNSNAASTRRIILYEYNKETSIFNWKGFITLTYPTATAHTIRGFSVSRELYTTGTVGVSGTTVTGSGTSWLSDRMSVGCRIGFGSTDPSLISTWYEISNIAGENSITLTSNAGTISPGTPYVIEDIILITANLNVTATNGGLFIAKGIRPEIFTSTGTTIPAATTVDNIRAVYWLADAPTVTNTTPCGSALNSRTNWVNQLVYVLNATGPRVYCYNFRAPLTLTAGRDTTTNTIQTGNQTVTGTISQTNNGRIGTLSHGPGSGIPSLYFVTTTRVYRCALTGITNGSTTWQSDAMVEIPPGGTNTYSPTSVMTSCEISSDIDRLVISTSGAAGARSYITKYNTISDPFDHIFLNDDKQLDQSSADSGSVPHPAILSLPFSFWIEGGILYLARVGTTAATNQLYTLPIGAHLNYAIQNSQLLITPKLDISESSRLYNIYVNKIEKLGTDAFSLPTEPCRIYYRTSGISDNSGTWNLLDDSGDLSGVTGTEIQFAFSFKVIGTTCIPARLMGFSLIYEDNSTDGHYQPSVANSNITTNVFAYRQSILWNSNIPNMRIRLYNASTNNLILDDDITSSAYGTWEYSSNNGTSWNAWDNTQDVVGNYIRYTANSLPGGTRIKALLTQA